jgi:hypothetical protein
MAIGRKSHLQSSRRDRCGRGCRRREVVWQGPCRLSRLSVSWRESHRVWSLQANRRGKPLMPPEELLETIPGIEARYRYRYRFHGQVFRMGPEE